MTAARRDRVRVAIVGVGYWGSKLARTFAALPTAQVTALCDLDAPALAAAGAAHPTAHRTGEYGDLLGRHDVDAVVLATPPSRHYAMARAALAAGRHCWVEKPLALTAANGRDLVETAERVGRTLFVDETFLYDPLVAETRRLVEAGALGRVHHLSFERLGMGRIRRDSDVWWNSAPHDLSILFHLVPGRVTDARLHLHAHLQPGIADIAVCDLVLEGGVSAHLHLSWLHPEKTATVTMIGAERMLRYEGRFEKRALVLYDWAVDRAAAGAAGRAGVLPIRHFAARRLELPAPAEPLALAAEHVVASILDGVEPLTSGARSLRVIDVLEAAHRGATRGGAGT